MGRRPRPIGDELVYHPLNRGNNRAPVFLDEADHEAFLEALGRTRRRHPFRLSGYCLMTNHYHLLRPEPGQSISRILRSLTVAHTARDRDQGGDPVSDLGGGGSGAVPGRGPGGPAARLKGSREPCDCRRRPARS